MDQTIEQHLTGLLKTVDMDILGSLRWHESHGGGGFFSTPVSCFTMIDYLASLAYGESSTGNAVTFIGEFLGRVNPKYAAYADLLYAMFRHGTVHQFDPNHYFTTRWQSIFRLGWSMNNSSLQWNRDVHLKCLKVLGKEKGYLVSLNLFQLADDLKSSIQLFIHELRDDGMLNREAVQEHYNAQQRPLGLWPRKKRFCRGVPRQAKIHAAIKNAIQDCDSGILPSKQVDSIPAKEKSEQAQYEWGDRLYGS